MSPLQGLFQLLLEYAPYLGTRAVYGGGRELAIALAILGGSLVLYPFRRVAQDRMPLRLREEAPALPTSGTDPFQSR